MRIALVHDMLVKFGGAERVLKKLMDMYPEAPVHVLFMDKQKMKHFFPVERIRVVPSVQRIYDCFKNQRITLPFLPKAVESIDLSLYETVIISHTAFVHGVITKPETRCIVYYHTPARYLWDRTFEYRKEIGWNKGVKGIFLQTLLHKLRIWDYQASQRHDITLANSYNVANRLKKYYKLSPTVIYPGVQVERFFKRVPAKVSFPQEKYFLIVSALTEFKRIDIAIQAFCAMKQFHLVIVGEGKYQSALQKMIPKEATSYIHFLGRREDEEVTFFMQKSMGVIFCGEDDFGIVPIESIASGTPVFGYYGGGLKETMIPKVTGDFFYDKEGKDFIPRFLEFVDDIEHGRYKKNVLQEHAKQFSEEVFEQKIRAIVEKS